MPNVIGSLFRNLFGRKDLASDAALASGGKDDSDQNEGDAVTEVWLYPDSEELDKQTLLKARRIDQSVFRIGRRVSGAVHYPHDDPPELLIVEQAPFTLSKLHCQIEQDGKKVILRDLGSRSGTILDNKRLRKDSRKPSSVVVPKGSHSLILGYPDGLFRLRLEVR